MRDESKTVKCLVPLFWMTLGAFITVIGVLIDAPSTFN
jgi:hypothetical protein